MITGKRISPRKPHFFKPLLPGFHNELLIPISFLKYLNGQKCESGLLRSIQGDWLVKINGRRFEDGWTKFTEDHDLQVGDFLVFRHEGDMVFHIMVFDSSTCQKEYPPSDGKETDPIEVKNIRTEESLAKLKFNLDESEAKATPCTLGDHPYFLSIVKPHCLKWRKLRIPMKFARSNGLSNRACKMILIDQKGRQWATELRYNGTQAYIGRGWHQFHIANGIKEGDAFKFELIQNGKMPIVNFICVTTESAFYGPL